MESCSVFSWQLSKQWPNPKLPCWARRRICAAVRKSSKPSVPSATPFARYGSLSGSDTHEKDLTARATFSLALSVSRSWQDDPAVKHGPTFAGLYGRKAGSLPGFKYSDVMRTSEMVWDEATLMSYLARPNTVTSHPMLMSKSAKLVFRDVRRRDVRRDLVGYLKVASAQ